MEGGDEGSSSAAGGGGCGVCGGGGGGGVYQAQIVEIDKACRAAKEKQEKEDRLLAEAIALLHT